MRLRFLPGMSSFSSVNCRISADETLTSCGWETRGGTCSSVFPEIRREYVFHPIVEPPGDIHIEVYSSQTKLFSVIR